MRKPQFALMMGFMAPSNRDERPDSQFAAGSQGNKVPSYTQVAKSSPDSYRDVLLDLKTTPDKLCMGHASSISKVARADPIAIGMNCLTAKTMLEKVVAAHVK